MTAPGAVPKLLSTVAELRAATDAMRVQGSRIGLVPTMGALHAGHRSLMLEARRHAEYVIVTIFVNPTQFGPNEDLDKYPAQLDKDLELCARAGVDAVFAPRRSEMYPPGDSTRVRVSTLTDYLCGASRPHHFEGVATIVTKLLIASGPCTAVFGKKDFQQLRVVQRLVADLLLPVQIVPAAIVREPDGLAMSSRNAYLSGEERKRALALSQGLSRAARRYADGERSVFAVQQLVRGIFEQAQVVEDYVTVAQVGTLQPLSPDERMQEPVLLAVAGFVGSTRLIDNMVLGEDDDPLGGFAAQSPVDRGEGVS